MCGIAGWVSDRTAVDARVLRAMVKRLAHRGPDGEAVEVFGRGQAGFGHRRLAILDLGATGAQPMERAGRWLVHNGEIYNFRELRRDEETRGARFVGESDTEVLLALLTRLGTPALDLLDGMFAFAHWDPSDRSLLLARDRLGIKPLYYWDRDGEFLFASEPKALLAHPAVGRRVDPEALGDYLAYGYVPFDRSIFQGIRKLPPGHLLLRRDGRTEVRRYWDFEPRPIDGDPVEVLRGLLDASVARQRVSDVSVGTFLSGGLDSTTVTALLKGHLGEALPTFTVAYGDGGLEDVRYARIAAEALGTEHVDRVLEIGPIDRALETIGPYYDEPLANATNLAVFQLAAIARSRVKVVLSGDGGDEVFGGYGWHESALRYGAIRKSLGPAGWLLGVIDRFAIEPSAATPFARVEGTRRITASDSVDRYFALRGVFTARERRKLFGREFSTQDEAWAFRLFDRADLPPAHRVCRMDLGSYLPDNNLALVDRSSMAHGLEVRVPLLDHTLVEYVASVADEWLVRPGATKRLFRRAIAPWLPREILDRPKYGFSPPFKTWVRRNNGAQALQYLRRGALVQDGLLDLSAAEKLLFWRAPKRWNKLWLLVVLESWYRRWVVESSTDGMASPSEHLENVVA